MLIADSSPVAIIFLFKVQISPKRDPIYKVKWIISITELVMLTHHLDTINKNTPKMLGCPRSLGSMIGFVLYKWLISPSY